MLSASGSGLTIFETGTISGGGYWGDDTKTLSKAASFVITSVGGVLTPGGRSISVTEAGMGSLGSSIMLHSDGQTLELTGDTQHASVNYIAIA